jgi:hypothetical protein
MRSVKNIPVAVSSEVYNQTRMLATEYRTTVTAMLAYLLKKTPCHLKTSRFLGTKPTQSAPATPTPATNPIFLLYASKRT